MHPRTAVEASERICKEMDSMEDALHALRKPAADSGEQAPSNHLPATEIALHSLALPFQHILPLLRMGVVPFLLAVSLQIVGNIFRTTGVVHSLGLFWVMLGLIVVYIPFDVGWTRLVITGPPSIANRSLFPFGRPERYYLLAVFLLGCSCLTLAFPVFAARLALRGFNHDLQVAAGLLLLWTLVAIVVCVIRLLFVFPAIATNSYQGLTTAWKQTKGNFETLALLYTGIKLPYLLMLAILDAFVEPYSPFILKAMIMSVQCLILLLSQATTVGMIALAYKRLVQGIVPE
jgi:hypothetical protein